MAKVAWRDVLEGLNSITDNAGSWTPKQTARHAQSLLVYAAEIRTNNAKVMAELVSIIDYLAKPSDHSPGARARIGTESGPHGVKGWPPGAWDGGKQWDKTDKRINKAVDKARALIEEAK